MKKFFKILLIIAGSVISIVIILALILWIKSPGITDQIIDNNGNLAPKSISKIEKLRLGGVDQYLIIRGADSTKPVVLFLHGGPGSPEIAFMRETNSSIENDFVMVYWEQRGAGKSYSKDIPVESMKLSQFIDDTKELSQILARRFKKNKIYLMGHSWGSFLGIMTAYKYPELYYAYFGIGQLCNQYRGEQIAFEWVKQQAEKANNVDALKGISALKFPDSTASAEEWWKYLMPERNYINHFGGGITHKITGMWPIIKLVLNAKEYTFKEKMNFMSGSLFSLKCLWSDVVNHNLFTEIDSLKIPVYIFHGKYDYTVPYPLSKEFFEHLKAPKKEFFTFENSAHSPIMEEPDKFNAIFKEKAVDK